MFISFLFNSNFLDLVGSIFSFFNDAGASIEIKNSQFRDGGSGCIELYQSNAEIEFSNLEMSYCNGPAIWARQTEIFASNITIGEGVEALGRWPNQLIDSLKRHKIYLDSATIIAQTGWRTDELKAALATHEKFNYDSKNI